MSKKIVFEKMKDSIKIIANEVEENCNELKKIDGLFVDKAYSRREREFIKDVIGLSEILETFKEMLSIEVEENNYESIINNWLDYIKIKTILFTDSKFKEIFGKTEVNLKTKINWENILKPDSTNNNITSWDNAIRL